MQQQRRRRERKKEEEEERNKLRNANPHQELYDHRNVYKLVCLLSKLINELIKYPHICLDRNQVRVHDQIIIIK